MSKIGGSWRFDGANDVHVQTWSWATVRKREDLYSSTNFGAERDLTCDCGALSGEVSIGLSCKSCGVTVERDAAGARRRRMAKIDLACHYRHPLTNALLTLVPVLPLAMRVRSDGTPNRLGLKYEAVVEANARYALSGPPKRSMEYISTTFITGAVEVDATIAELVGSQQALAPGITFGGSDDEASCLLELLYEAIFRLSADVDVIARACCLIVAFSAAI